MKRSNIKVLNIHLYCTATRLGEVVKVTGNCPQLGNWNAQNSLTLHTTEADYPIWKAGILIDSGLTELEYKYIIVPS
jgi:hypothetical protein